MSLYFIRDIPWNLSSRSSNPRPSHRNNVTEAETEI